jgi:hypothetical protein
MRRFSEGPCFYPNPGMLQECSGGPVLLESRFDSQR